MYILQIANEVVILNTKIINKARQNVVVYAQWQHNLKKKYALCKKNFKVR